MGADAGLTFARRDDWLAGHGPDLDAAPLSATGGIGDPWRIDEDRYDPHADPAMPNPVFDGPDQARPAVRRVTRAGADWIKLVASGGLREGPGACAHLVSDAEMHAVVDEARRQGGR